MLWIVTGAFTESALADQSLFDKPLKTEQAVQDASSALLLLTSQSTLHYRFQQEKNLKIVIMKIKRIFHFKLSIEKKESLYMRKIPIFFVLIVGLIGLRIKNGLQKNGMII